MLAAPGGGFTDVYATNPIFGSVINSFCWSIEWARNRGVTSGCADGTRYFSVLAPYSPLRAAATALAPGATTAPPAANDEPAAEPAHWRAAHSGSLYSRCQVAGALGLQGVVRGGKCRTTIGDDRAVRPLDRVNRQFQASRPNQLWVVGFTYVATWAGFVYVAFVIDVLARRIIGWWVARSMHTDLVLDALEQALKAPAC